MKPFTLIWWMRQLDEAQRQEKICVTRFHYHDAKENKELRKNEMDRGLYLLKVINWIKIRIINKYGENQCINSKKEVG